MSESTLTSETIGRRLKRLRLERSLSQRELAGPGVSYAYISRIEAGTRQPSVKALRTLARKLGVTAEYLETGNDIDDTEARELHIADAELALRLLDAGEAERTLHTLLEDCIRAGDAANGARVRIALGFAAAERGDHARAVTRLEDALRDERPCAADRIDVYATLGRAYAAVGTPERAVRLFEDCLEDVADTVEEDSPAYIRYASLLSYALSDMGDLARAEAVVKDALDRAQAVDDPYMRVRLYWSLARLSEMEGKSAAALQYIRRAIALLEATDDTLHLARAHVLCALIMTSQGDGSGAQTHLDQAERLFGSSPSTDDVVQLHVERARASAALGLGAKAVTLARQAIDKLGDQRPAELGAAFWALGEGLTLEGEIDAATEAFRRSVDLLADNRRWREAAQAARAWGKALRAAGRETQALDVMERATELGLNATPAEAAVAER
jgi:tetratricopeptide (TPR) repeat protein